MMLLVLDIGSSSARALLFDAQAQLVQGISAAYTYEFDTLPLGSATIDTRKLQEAVEGCIDAILQHTTDIQAVGIATFVGNVLGINANSQPITPIYSYADTRSAEDVAILREKIDTQVAHQRTGTIHHTAYLPGRLHWLRRTEPDVFHTVEKWVDFGTYLYSQWFSKSLASYSASSWSGLLNRENLTWDSEWLELLEMDETKFPPLADYDEFQCGLNARYAERWPALKNVPFYLAVGDGVSANIGSGAVTPKHIALTVGTTAALRIISGEKHPVVPHGLWSYRVNKALHLIGGATTEGGNIFNWVYETFTIPDIALAENEIGSRAADIHGLTFLPLLTGERSPGWSLGASGAVIGLRLSTTPIDILQAALEGVALRLSLIEEQLKKLTGENVEIMVSGGAVRKSRVWTQIIANALNHPLNILDEVELTARGVAIMILHTLKGRSLDDFPPHVEMTLFPEKSQVEALAQARERQVELYRKLIE